MTTLPSKIDLSVAAAHGGYPRATVPGRFDSL
jgi:hypothetical protein